MGNVVPGVARVGLDVRHARDSVRNAAVEELLAKAESIAMKRGLTLARTGQLEQPAVPMDETPHLPFLTDAIEAAGFPCVKTMPSGATRSRCHRIMANDRLPTAMLFLRTPGGIRPPSPMRSSTRDKTWKSHSSSLVSFFTV